MKQYWTYVIKSKNVFIIHTWGIISHIHSDAQGKSSQRFQHRTHVFRKTLLNCHLDDYIRVCMIKHYAEHSYTIIFQTVWHFASASSLKFSHDDHNKDNDWIFNLNEISISNTYIDQLHLVCVEHGFVVNKINTSIKKTVHTKFDLKVHCDMQALFM